MIYSIRKNDEIVYIGQTVMTLAQRKSKHIHEANRGKGSILGAGMRKHGIDSFIWVKEAEITNQIECCAAEKELIAKYQPKYNLQCGGKKGFEPWNKGKKEKRKEVLKKISVGAQSRKGKFKRGHYTETAVKNIRSAKLKTVAKPFLCLENGKTYKNKVEASDDLKIPAGGISLVLMPTTKNKSYYGYHFEYLAQDKSSLIDLETQRWATRRKAKASVND